MDNRPIISFIEAGAARGALGSVLAGEASEAEGFPATFRERAQAAHSKLCAMPRGATLIAFSLKELELLWLALGNGAGDDTMNHLGLRADEKRTLASACNAIGDAGKQRGPRFGA